MNVNSKNLGRKGRGVRLSVTEIWNPCESIGFIKLSQIVSYLANTALQSQGQDFASLMPQWMRYSINLQRMETLLPKHNIECQSYEAIIWMKKGHYEDGNTKSTIKHFGCNRMNTVISMQIHLIEYKSQ